METLVSRRLGGRSRGGTNRELTYVWYGPGINLKVMVTVYPPSGPVPKIRVVCTRGDEFAATQSVTLDTCFAATKEAYAARSVV